MVAKLSSDSEELSSGEKAATFHYASIDGGESKRWASKRMCVVRYNIRWSGPSPDETPLPINLAIQFPCGPESDKLPGNRAGNWRCGGGSSSRGWARR